MNLWEVPTHPWWDWEGAWSSCSLWEIPVRLQPAISELGPVPEARRSNECQLYNSGAARRKPLARPRGHTMGIVRLASPPLAAMCGVKPFCCPDATPVKWQRRATARHAAGWGTVTQPQTCKGGCQGETISEHVTLLLCRNGQNVPDRKDDRTSEAESVSSRGEPGLTSEMCCSRTGRRPNKDTEPASAGRGKPKEQTHKQSNAKATRRARPATLATPWRHEKGKVGLKNQASTTLSCSVFFGATLGPSRNSRQAAKVCLCATSCLLGKCELARGVLMIGVGVQNQTAPSGTG